MLRLRCLAYPLPVLLAGCQTPARQAPERPRAAVTLEESEPWRSVASPETEASVDEIQARWRQALQAARTRAYVRRVAAEGALLQPAAGLPRAAPAPGPYRCRVVRIGGGIGGGTPYTASKPGFCFVGVVEDQLSLTAEPPAHRLGGYLWEEKDSRRLVFLGSEMAPGAKRAGVYGESPARDAAGLFERIGDFRYRLTIPTRGAAGLLVFDLTAYPNPSAR
ncbi:MAG TPA: DUF4893 domain-containing protein [Allosphingosinicella sp.]|jgi:hypothetical protein